MSNEISSDVEYLINQLNKIENNKNELKLIYNDQQINGQNRLTKEETQQQPNIQINNSSKDNSFRTLVCFYLFYLF
jgi:hypothetical protein